MTVREFLGIGLPNEFIKLARPIFDEDGNRLRFEAYSEWIATTNKNQISENDLSRVVIGWGVVTHAITGSGAGLILNTVKGE